MAGQRKIESEQEARRCLIRVEAGSFQLPPVDGAQSQVAIDGSAFASLLAGSWMATDGTGLKVLIPKLPTAHNGYRFPGFCVTDALNKGETLEKTRGTERA